MYCNLTASCRNPATTFVHVDDGRTAFQDEMVPACAECAAASPAYVEDYKEWLLKMAKEKIMARMSEGAVVHRKQIRVEQVEGYWWYREVRFNPHTGIFSVRMPENFRKDFPDTPTPSSKTMDGAIKAFEKTLESWETMTAKTIKVIVYSFPMNYERPKAKGIKPYKREDLDANVAFGLEWGVRWKKEASHQEPRYYQAGPDGEPDFSDDVRGLVPREEEIQTRGGWGDTREKYERTKSAIREIEWTEAREAFFVSLEKTIGQLCERVLAFEAEVATPKGIDALLAGSQTLLLGPKS